jgi:hypothetical protein
MMIRPRNLPLVAPQQTIGLPPVAAMPDTALIVLLRDLLAEAAARPALAEEVIAAAWAARSRAERALISRGGTGRRR